MIPFPTFRSPIRPQASLSRTAQPHPPHVVFAAYADIDQRVVWSAPSDDEIVIFESHDFTVGGVDE